jgi:hypothetical protein
MQRLPDAAAGGGALTSARSTPAALDSLSTSAAGNFTVVTFTTTIWEIPQMAHFTVRLGGLVEATCDNLAAALHKATWAKRDCEVYTVHRDDTLVATATSKHTTMQAA